ncbi:MAG: sigma-70 family RNA polymerase sigma factor [Bacteroidales bacterium]|nr:sigma-70 family RNA polymerase sigma factor [Bacteroidales bacterium]
MKRMAEKILNDDDLANDAVQEAFVRLWRKRWRLGLMEDPQGFSIRTLRNLCIDMLRRDKHRQENMGAAAAELYNHSYNDDQLDAEQRYRQVEQAIASLPPQQQQLIEMKYVKQMSIHEMAQQTGLSETNITTLLSRAYAALRNKVISD